MAAAQRYYPYGAVRQQTGDLRTAYGFTGQRRDAATALLYYGARYYDPALGRFISADTLVPAPGNPQALNRYAYVSNNPLKYVDPSGHDGESPWWAEPFNPDREWATAAGRVRLGDIHIGESYWTDEEFYELVKTDPYRAFREGSLDTLEFALTPFSPIADISGEFGKGTDSIFERLGHQMVGFGADAFLQLLKDRSLELSPGQRVGRSVVVGYEGIGVSFLSSNIGGSLGAIAGAEAGLEIHPFAFVVTTPLGYVSGYLVMNLIISDAVEEINITTVFPRLGLSSPNDIIGNWEVDWEKLMGDKYMEIEDTYRE